MSTCVTFASDVDLTAPSTLRSRIGASDRACVVNDASPPFAIVAVNNCWSNLCGYDAPEALGKSPATLLHGEGTNKSKAHDFATRLLEQDTASTTLLNYTKAGHPFVHRLQSTKIVAQGKAYFVTESSEERDPEVVQAVLANAGEVAFSLKGIDTIALATFLAISLIAIGFLVLETLAASAPGLSSGAGTSEQAVPAYRKFWSVTSLLANDPYFYSVFNGVPLIG